MSEIKVSQMPEASNINDNDLLMIVQGGYNKKIPKELLEIPTKAHQINVSTEVDNTYKVNLLKTKNLTYIDAESKTVSNVTFTNNGNGTMTINGTASANIYFKVISRINLIAGKTYTLSTNITTSNSVFFYSNDSEKVGLTYADLKLSSGTSQTFTPTISGSIDLILYIYTGTPMNSTIQIQVEEGSTATEYEPFINNQINVNNEKYSDTINVGATEDSRSRVNILKSKNLLNCNSFSSYSVTNVSVTSSYTDGKLDYINATKSATTTNNVFVVLAQFIFNEPTGTYKLSGCPIGGGNDTYSLYLVDNTTTQDVYPRNEGTPASVTLTKGHQYTLYLRMSNTATFSDKKFYPMLIRETETNDTYEPYIVPSIKVDNEEIYRKPKVLWENPSITSDFANQTITLNDSLENYDYYEVIFLMSKYEQLALSSGLIPSSMSTSITTIRLAGGTGIIARYRDISRNSATTLMITKASKISGSSTTITEEVDRVIPYRIIGH